MNPTLPPLSTVGIGSVPFEEGRDSCREIFKDWDIPFWPQYPARSLRENFLFQFLNGFPGLSVSESQAAFDERRFHEENPPYQKRLDRAFREKNFISFEPTPDFALGYFQMGELLKRGDFPEKQTVKLQITGPGTIWKSFFAEKVSKKYESEIRKTLIRTLTAAGLAQIQRIAPYKKNSLIFIDELAGSDDFEVPGILVRAFKNLGGFVGIHPCGRSDWRGLENSGIHVFHFDATHPFKEEEAPLDFLEGWIKKGNWIAWGLVPTFPSPDFETTDFSPLLLKICEILAKRGLPKEEVLGRSLLAPACGTGTLGFSQNQAVTQSLQVTAQGLRRAGGEKGTAKSGSPRQIIC